MNKHNDPNRIFFNTTLVSALVLPKALLADTIILLDEKISNQYNFLKQLLLIYRTGYRANMNDNILMSDMSLILLLFSIYVYYVNEMIGV